MELGSGLVGGRDRSAARFGKARAYHVRGGSRNADRYGAAAARIALASPPHPA
jgi:hypothetical protein